MKLEKKHYLIGAVSLFILGYVVYKNRTKKETLNKSVDTNRSKLGSNQVNSVDEELFNNDNSQSPFPIQMGSEGIAVKAIQIYMNSTCPSDLKAEGIYPLEVNGIWDEVTEKACLACSILKRNKIDQETFDRILRDLQSANINLEL